MPDARTIVIVAPNWLGDAVMALSSIADIRLQYGDARVLVAARRSVADLFAMVPGIDGLIVDPDAAALRENGAAVAILLPNSFASAWLVKRAGIAERWGYAADMRSWMLTAAIRKPRTLVHQGEYYKHLIRELGIVTGPLEPVIAVPPAAVKEARTLLAQGGCDDVSRLIVLAPGAAYGKAKQWIPSHVVDLMTHLVRERLATCALVGSRGDAPTTRAIRHAIPDDCQAAVIDLAGCTTLPVLAGILSLARVCVSNDSGAMHLAAAAGVPVAAIFGSTNERATSPLTRNGVAAEVLTHPVWCRPCMLRECPIDHRCMTGIESTSVLAAVDRLAEGRPA
jgi:heptosyltransferase-2